MSSSSSTSQTEEHQDSASKSRSRSTSTSSSASSSSNSESETPVTTERLPVETPEVHPAAGQNEIPMTPITGQRKRPDTRGLGSVPGVRGFASPAIAPSAERGGRDSLEGRESIDTDFQEDVKPAVAAGHKKKKLFRRKSSLGATDETADKKTHTLVTDDSHDKDLSPAERIEKKLKDLESSPTGLTAAQAQERLAKFGPNSLPTKKNNPVLKYLSYMWNPLSWVMEAAAIIAIILLDYVDFALIIALLLINSTIAFWEEYSSGSAIQALQAQLTPTCKCYRDGVLNKETPSADLVPGDVIVIRLGDVIPADSVLLSSGEEGEGHVEELKVDQSSLTGESLPVNKHVGDEVYSGSTAKQGEMKALVTATGVNTFFGKAASLISSVEEIGHFQRVLRSVGWFCIILIVAWVALELIIQFAVRRAPCLSLSECYTLDNMLVLIVGGIPIAMPTVLSVTMAIGAQRLATKKAIVSRLTAVEELAGMDILCSDKTGTLTKNKLTVADPISYNPDVHPQEILFYAALASTPETGDSIDMAMVEHCNEEMTARLKNWHMVNFQPFDPISKKTAAKVRDDNGKIMWASKGAPQVMLNLAANKEHIHSEAQYDIDELAKHGYRSLGVSRSDDGTNWEMIGMIPMFDPPRDDTKETIEKIKDWGVGLKMITGDQLAIAKETARLLGMNQNILPSKALRMPRRRISAEFGMSVTDLVETADGFAEVFPEDKFAIVKKLQRMKHVVGMTGDGVNDAPALKKANIGIAVAGATDAARGASDIVLTDAGLSVIVDAIIGSRKIFQRMKNYATYSIAVAVRVVFTFGLLTTGFDFYFPTIAIVILALLNDGCMLTISKDRVKPSRVPDQWSLKEIYSVAIVIGLYLSASTIVLYHITINTDFWARTFDLPQLDQNSIRGLIYLQVSLSGLAAIFVTRAQGFSYTERPSWLVLGAFLFAQVVASVLCAYGLGGYPNNGVNNFGGSGWGYVLVAWIWCIIWYVPLDFLKFLTRGIARGHLVWPTRDYIHKPVHQIQTLQPTTTIGYTRAGLTFVNRTLVKDKKKGKK